MNRICMSTLILVSLFQACVIDTPDKKQKSMDEKKEKAFTSQEKGISFYTLSNSKGMTVEFSNYGATILAIKVPNRDGKIEEVTLGYDNLEDLQKGASYFGCVVGRYANRIGNGTFTIEGVQYQAPQNNGVNSLHGGLNSIDKKVWKAEILNGAIKFNTSMADGENGYPGNMNVEVVYSLRDDNSLVIDYSATTDKTTVLNITNHTYFNLSGNPAQTILNHEIQIQADAFTPVDSNLIPTGELKAVKGIAFDFTSFKSIGKEIDGDDPQLVFGKGYDHNFVLNKMESGQPNITVKEKTSGRVMEVFTTQPGVQFYTGNFLNGSQKGRGVAYEKRTGFCLETQHFPDSPNKPDFPSTLLKPGEVWKSQTIYKFGIEN